MWVPNPPMERALISFQHRVSQRLTGIQTRRWGEGSWEYPLLAVEMAGAGFEEIGVYVTRRQNTIAQYIETRPIMDPCEKYVWRPGA